MQGLITVPLGFADQRPSERTSHKLVPRPCRGECFLISVLPNVCWTDAANYVRSGLILRGPTVRAQMDGPKVSK